MLPPKTLDGVSDNAWVKRTDPIPIIKPLRFPLLIVRKMAAKGVRSSDVIQKGCSGGVR